MKIGGNMENPYEFIRAASSILKRLHTPKLEKLFNDYVDAELDAKFGIVEKIIIEKMRMN